MRHVLFGRPLRRSFCGLLLMIGLVGCGPTELPYTDNSKDPAAFGNTIKQLVTDAVADARRSREPYDQIRLISNAINVDRQPVGEFAPVYEQLKSAADELADACESADGPVADMDKKLDDLLAMAERLPGETKTTN